MLDKEEGVVVLYNHKNNTINQGGEVMLFHKRNLKQIAIMFVVIFLGVAVNGRTAKAISSTTSVSITGVRQAMDQWCWAACAEIIGKTVFSGSTRTQFDVVNLLKRTDENPWPNVGGLPSDGAAGASYVAFYNKNFMGEYETLNFSEITYSLAKGYAVSTSGGYYESGERVGGHAVVVYMTQFIEYGAQTTYRVTYYDPWDGTTHTCSYEEFCDGTYNSRIYDRSVYVAGSIQ